MKLNYEEFNNKPKIPFYEKHKSPILWILSVLIFLVIALALSAFVYLCIEYDVKIVFTFFIIIGLLFLALICILLIHDKLEDKYGH